MDVLIVDDSAAIRKILKRVLQQAEIPTGQVYEASDGIEALQRLREQPVHLILSDINMPNMDGLQFLQQVKSSGVETCACRHGYDGRKSVEGPGGC